MLNLTTLIFWLFFQMVILFMLAAFGNERLLMLAPASVYGWMCVALFVGDVLWTVAALVALFRGDARAAETPRLPNVGQAVMRLLFPAPPVGKRTQYANRTTRSTAKPERVI